MRSLPVLLLPVLVLLAPSFGFAQTAPPSSTQPPASSATDGKPPSPCAKITIEPARSTCEAAMAAARDCSAIKNEDEQKKCYQAKYANVDCTKLAMASEKSHCEYAKANPPEPPKKPRSEENQEQPESSGE